ncbi:hypothetical protein BJF79_25575 [Actinomadura sp. CNU-125]|uniref:hypothetical protein n=1 Tax=Actinomadura sp. CNU-125 TaxID=1904961 RepID=UPI00096085BB|nr:hypothetical protein [Actinomadura sp. CNU-125]OLT10843.1 hypothetical protein BJF79_25575 [Actinomadura sp. CNU-125]
MNVRKLAVQGGAGIGGTILLAGAMWLHAYQPKVEARMLDPIRSGGDIGTDVASASFTVRVEEVVVARSLAPDSILDDKPPVGTDGVYVIVRLRGTSRDEPVQAPVRRPGRPPAGTTFAPTERPLAAEPPPAVLEPMIWTNAAFVFEVPKNRLAGAHLVVGTGGLLPQLSSAVDVDLGLSGSRAADLVRKAPERYELRVGT